MNLPPLVLASALLLWGWQNHLLVYALLMAAVLEAARFAPWRWDLGDADFNRLADVSGLGFVVVAVYLFDRDSFQGIYAILRWLPVVLFFLTATQLYSTRGRIKYSALFLSVRRAVARGRLADAQSIDLRFPYLVICLLSATGGDVRGRWLVVGLGAVLAWVLWSNRPARYSALVWTPVMAASLLIGYLGQTGILELRRILEPAVIEWFQGRVFGYRDPYRAYTAMGHIGRLKLSDRIVLRVRTEGRAPPPALLREASFQTFSKNIWLAGDSSFEELHPDIEGTVWELNAGVVPAAKRLSVARYLPRGKGLLAVPNGTFRIDSLPVDGLYLNPLGALKVLLGPGMVRYRASYAAGRSADARPRDADLRIPGNLDTLIERVAGELELRSLAPADAVGRLMRYFQDRFRYSVVLRGPSRVDTPLHEFLLRTRTGHCEFFATATVMLLRAAGIPARYATGYSIQEYSELEDSYIVRRRHAHSWALAYLDGAWRDVDTTPVVWARMEADEAPWWEGGYDIWSWLQFQLARWRWSDSEEGDGSLLVWLLVPLMMFLIWRLYISERVSRGRKRPQKSATEATAMGADSAFYRIERALRARGLSRASGETLSRWIERLARTREISGGDVLLRDILPIHYRYRFDPMGVSDADRDVLGQRVARWLAGNASV